MSASISYLSNGSPQGRRLSTYTVRFWGKAGTCAHKLGMQDKTHCVTHGTHSLLGKQGTRQRKLHKCFHPSRQSNPRPLACEPRALQQIITTASFGRLRSRVLENTSLKSKIKVSVYTSVCLSTLIYGTESWTTCRRHIKQLQSFHIRCLQRILRLKWQDKALHSEIFQRAGITLFLCV